jgi:hypothetical protein
MAIDQCPLSIVTKAGMNVKVFIPNACHFEQAFIFATDLNTSPRKPKIRAVGTEMFSADGGSDT